MVKYAITLGAAIALQGAAAVQLTRVVPDLQYPAPDACHPRGTITYSEGAYPPCLSQGEVEGLCAPPSDDVAGWTFQRDCMCKGSFFQDAIGCGACKQCNALQTHEETAKWDAIFRDIEASFCGAKKPESAFGGYWKRALAKNGEPLPASGDKRDRCVKPGDTVVEHYWPNHPKKQGPGLRRPVAGNGTATKETTASTATTETKGAVTTATTVSTGSVTTAATAATTASVTLHAAATVRQYVARVSAVAGVKASAKATVQAAGNVNATANAHVSISYAMAAAECQAFYVNGSVVPVCGSLELIPGSEASISGDVKDGAMDFSACTCAAKYLATKGGNLVPFVHTVSAKAEAHASVNIFSPAQCVGSCEQPAPKLKCIPRPSGAGNNDSPAPGAQAKASATAHAVAGGNGNQVAAAGNQIPSAGNAGNQAPSAGNAGNQAPSAGNAGNQAPSAGKAGNEAPSAGKAGNEAPSAGKAGNEAAPAGNIAQASAAAAATLAAPEGGVPATGAPAPTKAVPKSPIVSGAGSKGASAVLLAVAAFAAYAL